MSALSGSSTSPEHLLHQARAEKKRRNRVPVSCGPCRSRKMKCDRHLPCQNCVKRDSADACSYATSGGRKPKVQMPACNDEMQRRIHRLEGLVLSLMEGQPQKTNDGDEEFLSVRTGHGDMLVYHENDDEGEDDFDQDDDHTFGAPVNPASANVNSSHKMANTTLTTKALTADEATDTVPEDPSVRQIRGALGIMTVNEGESYFRGGTHINAILKEISEIKAFYHHNRESSRLPQEYKGEVFPFALSGPRLSKTQLLELIPPRHIVDEVLRNYFSWYGQMFHVIHIPSFFAEYEELWKSPETVKPLWLGMLFIMMHMSWQLFNFSKKGPPEYQPRAEELIQTYQHASESALVVGEFTRRKSYHYHTIRTLYLMSAAKVLDEGSEETWLLLGLIIRIALAMGLHRDGQQYNLPPFDVEMRRRLWTAVCCMDMTHAISMGLPSMIRESEFDTGNPLNAYDADIYEGMTEYPKPRPADERTEIAFYIFKCKIVRIYRKIVINANGIGPKPDYDSIMSLDESFRQGFASLPHYLRSSRSPELKEDPDPAYLCVQKIALEIVFHKGMITLHRGYASKSWKDKKYYYSRRILVNSCISMIDHQFSMANSNGDKMKLVQWFSTSLASFDFMHATISLCVDLWDSIKHGDVRKAYINGVNGDDIDPKRTIQVLERSKIIYSEKYGIDDSEAQKTLGIIEIVLKKVYSPCLIRAAAVPAIDRDSYDPQSPAKPTPSDSSVSPSALTPEGQQVAIPEMYKDMLTETEKEAGELGYTYPLIRGDVLDDIPPHQGLSLDYTIQQPQAQQQQWKQEAYEDPADNMDAFAGIDAPGQELVDMEWDGFMQEINLDPAVLNNEWWNSIPVPSQWQSMMNYPE
ncbi:fungal-specific transcription factor domain-containing protein [Peziza echinospora]|nr:fungal-specific transcription factor domain-containing protein [Peziza echinospora]